MATSPVTPGLGQEGDMQRQVQPDHLQQGVPGQQKKKTLSQKLRWRNNSEDIQCELLALLIGECTHTHVHTCINHTHEITLVTVRQMEVLKTSNLPHPIKLIAKTQHLLQPLCVNYHIQISHTISKNGDEEHGFISTYSTCKAAALS